MTCPYMCLLVENSDFLFLEKELKIKITKKWMSC